MRSDGDFEGDRLSAADATRGKRQASGRLEAPTPQPAIASSSVRELFEGFIYWGGRSRSAFTTPRNDHDAPSRYGQKHPDARPTGHAFRLSSIEQHRLSSSYLASMRQFITVQQRRSCAGFRVKALPARVSHRSLSKSRTSVRLSTVRIEQDGPGVERIGAMAAYNVALDERMMRAGSYVGSKAGSDTTSSLKTWYRWCGDSLRLALSCRRFSQLALLSSAWSRLSALTILRGIRTYTAALSGLALHLALSQRGDQPDAALFNQTLDGRY